MSTLKMCSLKFLFKYLGLSNKCDGPHFGNPILYDIFRLYDNVILINL